MPSMGRLIDTCLFHAEAISGLERTPRETLSCFFIAVSMLLSFVIDIYTFYKPFSIPFSVVI